MTSANVSTTAKGSAGTVGLRKDHKINWWLTAAVAVLSLTILVPLYFTVVTALKTPGEAGSFGLPSPWQGDKLVDVWEKGKYPKAALNSAIITACAAVATFPTDTFLAYAAASELD